MTEANVGVAADVPLTVRVHRQLMTSFSSDVGTDLCRNAHCRRSAVQGLSGLTRTTARQSSHVSRALRGDVRVSSPALVVETVVLAQQADRVRERVGRLVQRRREVV